MDYKTIADKFDDLAISSPATSPSKRSQWVKDPATSPTQPVRSSRRLKGQPAEIIIPIQPVILDLPPEDPIISFNNLDKSSNDLILEKINGLQKEITELHNGLTLATARILVLEQDNFALHEALTSSTTQVSSGKPKLAVTVGSSNSPKVEKTRGLATVAKPVSTLSSSIPNRTENISVAAPAGWTKVTKTNAVSHQAAISCRKPANGAHQTRRQAMAKLSKAALSTTSLASLSKDLPRITRTKGAPQGAIYFGNLKRVALIDLKAGLLSMGISPRDYETIRIITPHHGKERVVYEFFGYSWIYPALMEFFGRLGGRRMDQMETPELVPNSANSNARLFAFLKGEQRSLSMTLNRGISAGCKSFLSGRLSMISDALLAQVPTRPIIQPVDSPVLEAPVPTPMDISVLEASAPTPALMELQSPVTSITNVLSTVPLLHDMAIIIVASILFSQC